MRCEGMVVGRTLRLERIELVGVELLWIPPRDPIAALEMVCDCVVAAESDILELRSPDEWD